ncbi:hypothetical protein ES703_110847 [subsurface metagenome]
MGGYRCRLSSLIEELLYPLLGQLLGRLPPVQETLKLFQAVAVSLPGVLTYRIQGALAIKVVKEVINFEVHTLSPASLTRFPPS